MHFIRKITDITVSRLNTSNNVWVRVANAAWYFCALQYLYDQNILAKDADIFVPFLKVFLFEIGPILKTRNLIELPQLFLNRKTNRNFSGCRKSTISDLDIYS